MNSKKAGAYASAFLLLGLLSFVYPSGVDVGLITENRLRLTSARMAEPMSPSTAACFSVF